MHEMELVLIGLAYLLATSFFSLYLKRLSYSFLRLGRWFLGIGVALQWGFLVTWFIGRKIYVPSNNIESQLVILTLIASLCWLLSVRKTLVFVITVALPLIVIGLGVVHYLGGENFGVALPDPWLWTHIVFAVLGDGFFVFAALIACGHLIVEFLLKRRIVTSLFNRLPSLEEFDRILGEALLAGFVLLTIGLLMGVFFAQQYWNTGWFWDSQVIFTISSWLIYAVLLFLRALSAVYRGRRSAVLTIFGFIMITGLSMALPSKQHNTKTILKIENIEK